MNKTNVLVILTAAHGGGAEQLILDQMKHYDKNNINLHVATLRSSYRNDVFQSVAEENDVNYVNFRNTVKLSPLLFWKLYRYLTDKNIEVIHSHLLEPALIGGIASLVSNVKYFITKHNKNEFRKNWFLGWANYLVSLTTNKIICVSNAVKKFIKQHEHISESKLTVIHNGIDTEHFQPGDSTLRSELDIKDDTFLVGLVGRLYRQKGHTYLFQALEKLEDLPIHAIIAGKGPDEKRIRSEAKQRGIEESVTFVGYREDILNIYNGVDVICLPSLWEGLSITLLEAMSTETLVIMSDLANNKEVAIPDEEGIYFEKKNASALAEQLRYYYHHPDEAQEIAENARKKVISRYDFKTNLQQIEELYFNHE